MWRGHAEAAGQREVEATAHAPALDHRAGRSRESATRLHEPLSHLREVERIVAAQGGDLREIRADRKEF